MSDFWQFPIFYVDNNGNIPLFAEQTIDQILLSTINTNNFFLFIISVWIPNQPNQFLFKTTRALKRGVDRKKKKKRNTEYFEYRRNMVYFSLLFFQRIISKRVSTRPMNC